MWWCEECEEEFREPDVILEYHSELAGMGGILHEEFCVCPYCGSDRIEDDYYPDEEEY